jgi:hypothetical protein
VIFVPILLPRHREASQKIRGKLPKTATREGSISTSSTTVAKYRSRDHQSQQTATIVYKKFNDKNKTLKSNMALSYRLTKAYRGHHFQANAADHYSESKKKRN